MSRRGGSWLKAMPASRQPPKTKPDRCASFTCRSPREIRDKIAELERSGELPQLIEKAAMEAVDESDNDEGGA